MLCLATITFVLLASLVLASISTYPPDNMGVKVGTIATADELIRLSTEEYRITQIYEDEKGDWFVIDLESNEFWDIADPLKACLIATVVLPIDGTRRSLKARLSPDIEALWEEAGANRDAFRAAQADGTTDSTLKTRKSKCVEDGCFTAYNCGIPPCLGCPFRVRGGILGRCAAQRW